MTGNTNKFRPPHHGGGGNNRHLNKKKNQGNFGSGGSNSQNWRDTAKNANINDLSSNCYNNHHLTSSFVSLVGLPVEVQKTDGHIYEGILESVSNNLEIHLCHACLKSKSEEGAENGEIKTEKLMFQFCDVVRCCAKEVDLDFAKRETLMIDSAISGATGALVERELVQWQAEDGDEISEALDDLGVDSNNGGWEFEDMLKIHANRHGYQSTFDASMSNYMSPLDLEEMDGEKRRSLERKAEKTAREMQKDARHKELENVDSGQGEEELFSSVMRNPQQSNTNQNNSYPNSPRSGMKPSMRGGRNNNQPPRFQKTRNYEDNLQHNRIPNGVGQRHIQGHPEHNTNPPQAAGVPNENNKPQNYGGNTPQQSNVPPPLKSYSAVAAKQNQQFPAPAINNTNNKNKTPRPPGFANSPVAMEGGNPMVAVDNKGSPINQEQLDNAKQQYISNAKQAVAAGNASSPKPAVNQSPMSTTAQPESKSKTTQQLPQQPVIPQQQQQQNSSDSVAPKLSYSRMTASKMDQKTDAIQGTTPRGQGELSKYGKVTRIAEGDGRKNIDVTQLKEFQKGFVIKLDPKTTKKTENKTQQPTTVTTSPVKFVEEPTIQKSTATLAASAPLPSPAATTIVTKPSVSPIKTTSSTTSGNGSTIVSSVATTTSTTTTSVVTSISSSSTSSSTTSSKLNPNAKNFVFNPSVKEFKPTPKSVPSKPDYHPHHAQQQQQHHQQYVPNQHHHQQQQHQQQLAYSQQHHQQQQHIAQIQQQQQEVIQSATPSTYMPQHQQHAYRPALSAAGTPIHDIPNSAPILSNPTTRHPNPQQYMPHQQQPQQQMFVSFTPNQQQYQQPIMGQQQYVATQHGQQMVRIVHNPNVRMPTANYHHDNTNNPSSYILQATPHSVAAPHQSMANYQQQHQQQQQQTASSPAGNVVQSQQHMPHHPQQFMMANQQNPAAGFQHMAYQPNAPHYQRAGQQLVVIPPPNFHSGQQGILQQANFQPGN